MFNITAAWKATATLLLILGLLGVAIYGVCTCPWLFVFILPAVPAGIVWQEFYIRFKK